LLDQDARFTRQFSSRLLAGGTLWEIQSELEIRERPVLDEGATGIVLSEDVTGLLNSISLLAVLVHTDLSPLLND
jgi:hypothetical protein